MSEASNGSILEPPKSAARNGHVRSTRENFCNPGVVTRSWYALATSREVRHGRVRSFDLGGRSVAVYRDARGTVRAVDARCPHLGADLGRGQVDGEGLRCAFHGWSFGPDGACRNAPGYEQPPDRRARVYQVLERWGLVWVWSGAEPEFELPEPPLREKTRALRLPAREVRCHPHLVVSNGLDAAHFGALHGFEYTAPPELSANVSHRITLHLRGRPCSTALRHLTGTADRDVIASFTTIGGNLAWTAVESPARFHVLFSGLPTAEGFCRTSTVVFLPEKTGPRGLLRVAALMISLLRADVRLLDGIRFRRAFAEGDEGPRAFAELVDRMEVWR